MLFFKKTWYWIFSFRLHLYSTRNDKKSLIKLNISCLMWTVYALCIAPQKKKCEQYKHKNNYIFKVTWIRFVFTYLLGMWSFQMQTYFFISTSNWQWVCRVFCITACTFLSFKLGITMHPLSNSKIQEDINNSSYLALEASTEPARQKAITMQI